MCPELLGPKRDLRIDARRSMGRYPARQRRNAKEYDRDSRKHQRIVRAHAIQLRCDPTGQQRRADRAGDNPDCSELNSLPDHAAQHARAGRAERNANAELAFT